MRQIYLSFKRATQVLLNTECTRRLATPSHYLSKSGLSPQASPSLKIFSLLTKVKRKAMVATSCDRKDVHVPYQGGTRPLCSPYRNSVRTMSNAVLGQTHRSKHCPRNTRRYWQHPCRGMNLNLLKQKSTTATFSGLGWV